MVIDFEKWNVSDLLEMPTASSLIIAAVILAVVALVVRFYLQDIEKRRERARHFATKHVQELQKIAEGNSVRESTFRRFYQYDLVEQVTFNGMFSGYGYRITDFGKQCLKALT